MILHKSHGLGNDYLVADFSPVPPSPAQVALLCDRNRGAGADGLLLRVPSARADAGLRIWNPDGSEAEISGNGLRIFAHWLHHRRGLPAALAIEVGGRVVPCEVRGDEVAVRMGRASFEPTDVPVRVPLLDAPLDPAVGPGLRGTAVGLGNPHCVVFTDQDLDELPWRAWGATLERHPLFPHRCNVQFARVLAPDRVAVRIWERGAGPTLASGSSACAVAAAAVRTGRAGPALAIEAPGGTLRVEVGPDWDLRLEGPVEEVGTFALSEALLRRWAEAGLSPSRP